MQAKIPKKMAKSKGPKFYAVAVGRVAGIYNTWDECKAQTSGYSGAVFKGFQTHHEAQAFCNRSKSSSSGATATGSGNTLTASQGRKRSRDEDDVAASSCQRKKAATLNDKSPTSKFALQITIHFDGGSRGNPGVAGAGAEVIVVDNSTDVISTTTHSVREYCGERATNNYAEYKGLLVGLRQAKSCIEQHACTQSSSKRPLFRLQVYGDSNLIVQQLRGAWQCKHPNIVPLFQESQSMIREIQKYDTRSVVAFDHVYREHNKVADGERVHRRILFSSLYSLSTLLQHNLTFALYLLMQTALANEAMDRRESWITSTSDMSTGDEDDQKLQGVKNTTRELSKQDVIDVDDSDDSSHHSC
ncbi:hypothetical protein ACHAW5_001157 [Stephanodiscus triporus]|uniref:ribonuclease H n=1 Tax=Stephanodiscus triporus TaxID=2934178 RepID=A0ABD3MRD6_9STRA